jgi:DNA-binding NarL/FixJ family response regulator
MKMKKIKIILADDHSLVREGFKALLNKSGEMEVIAEAENGTQLLQLLDIHSPDVLLIDISMPELNGIEALSTIKKLNPNLKVIILTMHEEAEYVLKSIQVGANGYLLKNVELEELHNAIKKVVAGEKYFNATISNIMIDNLSKAKEVKDDTSPITVREKEILQYVAAGLSTKLIADKLEISIRTVETHRVHLLKKLHAQNTAELIKKATDLKII